MMKRLGEVRAEKQKSKMSEGEELQNGEASKYVGSSRGGGLYHSWW